VAYRVEITSSAERQLAAIEKSVRAQLLLHLYQLGIDPRPSAATLIDDENEVYRLNLGDYVIVYWTREKSAVILSVRLDFR
jgi:mRNA-degrading endonuclease RelE of RelBE toxin-antitoxin system